MTVATPFFGPSSALLTLAGAIARHDGCNLPPAAVLASRSAACANYVRQARDVLQDLHMPTLELLSAARNAVHDHVLFDGPHDRPTAIQDHAPTNELFGLVLRSPLHLLEQLAGCGPIKTA